MDGPHLHLDPLEDALLRLYRRKGPVFLILFFSSLSTVLAMLAFPFVIRLKMDGGDAIQNPQGAAWNILALCALVAPTVSYIGVRLLRHIDYAYKQVEALSTEDPLTGVRNRRGFFASADGLLKVQSPHAPALFGMLDVNDFKTVNDVHGHGVGDQALIELAHRLSTCIDENTGCVGRMGGDEFAVLAVGTQQQLDQLQRQLSRACTEFVLPSGQKIVVSLGTVQGTVTQDIDRMMSEADARLYDNKQQARRPSMRRAGTR